jgi:hypothetical protein
MKTLWYQITNTVQYPNLRACGREATSLPFLADIGQSPKEKKGKPRQRFRSFSTGLTTFSRVGVWHLASAHVHQQTDTARLLFPWSHCRQCTAGPAASQVVASSWLLVRLRQVDWRGLVRVTRMAPSPLPSTTFWGCWWRQRYRR